MAAHTDYLAKMAQCEMAARFAPAGVSDVWRSAADCYLLLADTVRGNKGQESAILESAIQGNEEKAAPGRSQDPFPFRDNLPRMSGDHPFGR